jgi:ERCC4-type nuclease
MTSCKLIVDTRERNVTRHSTEWCDINYEIKQITVGDYIVLDPNNNIMAVIERKSLDDFGASIIDGRTQNKDKLIELREKTNCRIIYIIEGPEYPKLHQIFGRVKYKAIQSSIFHLMINDGVSVINTKSTLHTAITLHSFIKSMETLIIKNKKVCEIPDNTHVDNTHVDNTHVDNTHVIGSSQNIENAINEKNSVDLISKKFVKSDNEILREMWSKFSNITIQSSDEYSKYFTLADIIYKRKPLDDFKLSSGKLIRPKIKNILSKSIDIPVQIKILSSVPLVSKNTATAIINLHTLEDLLKMENISEIYINNRKLGKAKEINIKKYFNINLS